MRRLWLPTLIGLTMALVFWQWPADLTALTALGVGDTPPSLYGVLSDAATGNARTSGWVLAQRLGGDARTVACDSRGNYGFHGLTPGRYTLTAFAAGCAVELWSDTLTLYDKASQQINLSLTHRPTGSVSGRVATPRQGTPIPGVEIRLVAVDEARTYCASTDQAGRFLAESMPVGRYYVFATAEGWGAVPWTGTADVVEGVCFTGVDFSLPPNPHAFSLSGRVTSRDEALRDVELCALGSSEGAVYVTRTDSTGRYELAADDPSHLYVWARRYDRGGVWFGSRAGWTYSDLQVIAERGLDLDLAPVPHGPWGIGGRIATTGRPLQSGCIEVTDERGRVRDIAPVWPGGHYRLSHLTPGGYLLRLIVPGAPPVTLGDVYIGSADQLGRDYDAIQIVQR